MVRRILKTLTNNLGFKLLALLIAIILWLVVYNINDPSRSKYFTATVTYENENKLRDEGLCWDVVNNSNVVSFKVTTKSSNLSELSDSNFKATADFDAIEYSEDKASATVPISIESDKYSNSIVYDNKVRYLELSLEEMEEISVKVVAKTEGKPTDGYAIGTVAIDGSNILTISGPKSIVDTIDKNNVTVSIDVSDKTEDCFSTELPVIHNLDGDVISQTKLTLSNEKGYSIQASVLSTKAVPINLGTSGSPAKGYSVSKVESSPSTVKIKGTSTVLNPVSFIDIPDSDLDVSGAKETIVTTIDITAYLPEGVSLMDSSDATITITISIESYETRNFSIATSALKINGLSSDNEINYTDSQVTVAVGGMTSDLERLSTSDIVGEIDVTDYQTGTHMVDIVWDIEGDEYTVGTSRVQIIISEKSKTTTSDNNTAGESDNNETDNSNNSDTTQEE